MIGMNWTRMLNRTAFAFVFRESKGKGTGTGKSKWGQLWKCQHRYRCRCLYTIQHSQRNVDNVWKIHHWTHLILIKVQITFGIISMNFAKSVRVMLIRPTIFIWNRNIYAPNEQTNQQTNEWANERMNGRINQATNNRTNAPTNQRTNKQTNQRTIRTSNEM